MVTNISFITAHFYDFDWTRLLVQNIRRFTDPEKIKEILVINQDRSLDSHNCLKAMDPLIRVVEYPKSEIHFQIQGHDHAAVLNRVIQEVSGDYICIFDSDAHPINDKWLDTCESIFEYYDAILALTPGSVINTHPCFMFIKKGNTTLPISFDEGLIISKIDTGRLVGKQLIKEGKKVFFVPPIKAFNGIWGYLYLDVVYHHRSASFSGASDERIKRQINWRNQYFKKLVVNKHYYQFTFNEFIRYEIYTLYNRIYLKIKNEKLDK